MSLQDLPVELIYELQLFALCPALPRVSTKLHNIFKSAPSSFCAEYILEKVLVDLRVGAGAVQQIVPQHIYNKALRYPLCSEDVLNALCRLPAFSDIASSTDTTTTSTLNSKVELPRWPFRSLAPKPSSSNQSIWSNSENPLPFLRHIYSCSTQNSSSAPCTPPFDINTNAHDGYALTKAVHAEFTPLVEFLLHHGATPGSKDCLAVLIAIRKRNLPLVKLLIERREITEEEGSRKREPSVKRGNKRRRLEDRVRVSPEMLKAAVRCGASDIVDYLTQEKGCIPDMQTLRRMMR